MIEFNTINLILLSICGAEFAMQVYMSDLANKIKRIFGLQQPYTKHFDSLGKVKFWKQLVGDYFNPLFPFFYLIILIFKMHKFVSELLNCPYCIAFWIGLAINTLILSQTLLIGFIYAFITVAFVAVLNKLHF